MTTKFLFRSCCRINLVCARMCWISKCQSSPGCIIFPIVCSVELPLGRAKKAMMVRLCLVMSVGLSIVTFTSPYKRNESITPLFVCEKDKLQTSTSNIIVNRLGNGAIFLKITISPSLYRSLHLHLSFPCT